MNKTNQWLVNVFIALVSYCIYWSLCFDSVEARSSSLLVLPFLFLQLRVIATPDSE